MGGALRTALWAAWAAVMVAVAVQGLPGARVLSEAPHLSWPQPPALLLQKEAATPGVSITDSQDGHVDVVAHVAAGASAVDPAAKATMSLECRGLGVNDGLTAETPLQAGDKTRCVWRSTDMETACTPVLATQLTARVSGSTTAVPFGYAESTQECVALITVTRAGQHAVLPLIGGNFVGTTETANGAAEVHVVTGPASAHQSVLSCGHVLALQAGLPHTPDKVERCQLRLRDAYGNDGVVSAIPTVRLKAVCAQSTMCGTAVEELPVAVGDVDTTTGAIWVHIGAADIGAAHLTRAGQYTLRAFLGDDEIQTEATSMSNPPRKSTFLVDTASTVSTNAAVTIAVAPGVISAERSHFRCPLELSVGRTLHCRIYAYDYYHNPAGTTQGTVDVTSIVSATSHLGKVSVASNIMTSDNFPNRRVQSVGVMPAGQNISHLSVQVLLRDTSGRDPPTSLPADPTGVAVARVSVVNDTEPLTTNASCPSGHHITNPLILLGRDLFDATSVSTPNMSFLETSNGWGMDWLSDAVDDVRGHVESVADTVVAAADQLSTDLSVEPSSPPVDCNAGPPSCQNYALECCGESQQDCPAECRPYTSCCQEDDPSSGWGEGSGTPGTGTEEDHPSSGWGEGPGTLGTGDPCNSATLYGPTCSSYSGCTVWADLTPDFGCHNVGGVCMAGRSTDELYYPCKGGEVPDGTPRGCYQRTDDVERLEGCECHASCNACGFNDSPVHDMDCISCADGSTVTQVYDDGTGYCGTEVPVCLYPIHNCPESCCSDGGACPEECHQYVEPCCTTGGAGPAICEPCTTCDAGMYSKGPVCTGDNVVDVQQCEVCPPVEGCDVDATVCFFIGTSDENSGQKSSRSGVGWSADLTSVCTRCQPGHYRKDGGSVCEPCPTCMPGTYAAHTCDGTAIGSSPAKFRKCKSCTPVPHCAAEVGCAEPGISVCPVCEGGFWRVEPHGGRGVRSQSDTCQRCPPTPHCQPQHTRCQSIQDSNGGTVQDSNGDTVVSQSVCDQCDDGFYAVDGLCIANADIYGCLPTAVTCSRIGCTCGQCETGYYIHKATLQCVECAVCGVGEYATGTKCDGSGDTDSQSCAACPWITGCGATHTNCTRADDAVCSHCEEGLELKKDRTQCVPKLCRIKVRPMDPQNGAIVGCRVNSTLQHMDHCNFICNPGYMPYGDPPFCSTGQMRAGSASCEPEPCTVRWGASGSLMARGGCVQTGMCGEGSVIEHGASCVPECLPQHRLVGKPASCALGDFSPGDATCELVDHCGDHNGGCQQVCESEMTAEGPRCECNPGYVVNPVNPLACQPADCPLGAGAANVVVPTNGLLGACAALTRLEHGSSCRLECGTGYYAKNKMPKCDKGVLLHNGAVRCRPCAPVAGCRAGEAPLFDTPSPYVECTGDSPSVCTQCEAGHYRAQAGRLCARCTTECGAGWYVAGGQCDGNGIADLGTCNACGSIENCAPNQVNCTGPAPADRKCGVCLPGYLPMEGGRRCSPGACVATLRADHVANGFVTPECLLGAKVDGGHVCNISCNVGYELAGRSPGCVSGGRFDEGDAQCAPKGCTIEPGFQLPADTVLAEQCGEGVRLAHGQSCQLRCQVGFGQTGRMPACTAGVFDGGTITCSPLPPPTNKIKARLLLSDLPLEEGLSDNEGLSDLQLESLATIYATHIGVPQEAVHVTVERDEQEHTAFVELAVESAKSVEQAVATAGGPKPTIVTPILPAAAPDTSADDGERSQLEAKSTVGGAAAQSAEGGKSNQQQTSVGSPATSWKDVHPGAKQSGATNKGLDPTKAIKSITKAAMKKDSNPQAKEGVQLAKNSKLASQEMPAAASVGSQQQAAEIPVIRAVPAPVEVPTEPASDPADKVEHVRLSGGHTEAPRLQPVAVGPVQYTGEARVVWSGPVLSASGFGQEARSFDLALQDRVSDMATLHSGDGVTDGLLDSLPGDMKSALSTMLQRGNAMNLHDLKSAIVVCHSVPPEWVNDRCVATRPRYMIGRGMFETDGLPSGWADILNSLDEVWVPSKFNQHTFAKSGVNPAIIHVVPEPVDTEGEFNPSLVQQVYKLPVPPVPSLATAKESPKLQLLHMLGLDAATTQAAADAHTPPGAGTLQDGGKGAFKFLSIFKWHLRKGPDVLLRAFCEEFKGDEPVVLYIKTNTYHTDPRKELRATVDILAEALHMRPEQLPRIVLLDEWIPQTALPSLYKAADAFVLPTRGEGWGLPQAEAMAMGLPTITTDWGGTTEFMKEGVALPVRASLVRLSSADMEEMFHGGSEALQGHSYAEPDVNHLRQRMRWAFQHQADAHQLGQRAREHMRANFSPGAVATITVNRLNAIKLPSNAGSKRRPAAMATMVQTSKPFQSSPYSAEAARAVVASSAGGGTAGPPALAKEPDILAGADTDVVGSITGRWAVGPLLALAQKASAGGPKPTIVTPIVPAAAPDASADGGERSQLEAKSTVGGAAAQSAEGGKPNQQQTSVGSPATSWKDVHPGAKQSGATNTVDRLNAIKLPAKLKLLQVNTKAAAMVQTTEPSQANWFKPSPYSAEAAKAVASSKRRAAAMATSVQAQAAEPFPASPYSAEAARSADGGAAGPLALAKAPDILAGADADVVGSITGRWAVGPLLALTEAAAVSSLSMSVVCADDSSYEAGTLTSLAGSSLSCDALANVAMPGSSTLYGEMQCDTDRALMCDVASACCGGADCKCPPPTSTDNATDTTVTGEWAMTVAVAGLPSAEDGQWQSTITQAVSDPASALSQAGVSVPPDFQASVAATTVDVGCNENWGGCDQICNSPTATSPLTCGCRPGYVSTSPTTCGPAPCSVTPDSLPPVEHGNWTAVCAVGSVVPDGTACGLVCQPGFRAATASSLVAQTGELPHCRGGVIEGAGAVMCVGCDAVDMCDPGSLECADGPALCARCMAGFWRQNGGAECKRCAVCPKGTYMSGTVCAGDGVADSQICSACPSVDSCAADSLSCGAGGSDPMCTRCLEGYRPAHGGTVCEPRPCTVAGVVLPPHASAGACVLGAALVHNATCEVACDDGYTVVGEQPRCELGVMAPASGLRCVANGCIVGDSLATSVPWAIVDDVCRTINGILDHGSQCGFQCSRGYVQSGVQPSCHLGNLSEGNLTCTLQRECGPSNGGCEQLCEMEAGLPPQPVCSCSAGWSVSANDPTSCTPDNCTVDEVPDVGPRGVLNGCEPGTVLPHRASCAIGCHEGFNAIGTQPSCVMGQFNPGQMVCVPAPCLVPPTYAPPASSMPDEGCVVNATVPHARMCQHRCLPGHTREGVQPSCRSGTFSPGSLVCTPNPCVVTNAPAPAFSVPDAGCMPLGMVDSGHTCNARCEKGFTLRGVQAWCEAGLFNPGSIRCEEDACLVPPTRPPAMFEDSDDGHTTPEQPDDIATNATNTTNTTTNTPTEGHDRCLAGLTVAPGTECRISCPAGYRPEGPTPTCARGEMTVDGAYCEPLPCVIPASLAAPDFGSLGKCRPGATLGHSKTCSLPCDAGYSPVGAPPSCFAASFSAGAQTCVGDDCPVPMAWEVPANSNGDVCRGATIGHAQKCEFGCEAGYTWHGEPPSCFAGQFDFGSAVCAPSDCVVSDELPTLERGAYGVECEAGAVLSHGGSCGLVCGEREVAVGNLPSCSFGEIDPGTAKCERMIDCEGDWGGCVQDAPYTPCGQTYRVATPAQFGGLECPAADGQQQLCAPGEGTCLRDCGGWWSTCDVNCTKYFVVNATAKNGGKECPAPDCEDAKCFPGEGRCPTGHLFVRSAPVPHSKAETPAAGSDGAFVGYLVDQPYVSSEECLAVCEHRSDCAATYRCTGSEGVRAECYISFNGMAPHIAAAGMSRCDAPIVFEAHIKKLRGPGPALDADPQGRVGASDAIRPDEACDDNPANRPPPPSQLTDAVVVVPRSHLEVHTCTVEDTGPSCAARACVTPRSCDVDAFAAACACTCEKLGMDRLECGP